MQPSHIKRNKSNCFYTFIGGGRSNSTIACYSTIVGGLDNSISSHTFSIIGGGCFNLIYGGAGTYSVITGGQCNEINGKVDYGVILGGCKNCLIHSDSFIAGSEICSVSSCTLHANKLWLGNLPTSSAGLPAGTVWNDIGTLRIV